MEVTSIRARWVRRVPREQYGHTEVELEAVANTDNGDNPEECYHDLLQDLSQAVHTAIIGKASPKAASEPAAVDGVRQELTEDDEAARKRSERAKKAAATRAANKAKRTEVEGKSDADKAKAAAASAPEDDVVVTGDEVSGEQGPEAPSGDDELAEMLGETQEITDQELLAVASEKATAGKAEAVKAVIREAGVPRLNQLEQKDRLAVLAELKAL